MSDEPRSGTGEEGKREGAPAKEKGPRNERLLPPFLLTVLVSLYLAPALFLGRVFFQKDAHLWFYPSRLYWRARVLAGELPLWVPELEMGKPFLANPSNGALYPLNLILLLPSPACVGQFMAVHVIIAALGAFALLRALDLSRSSAAFGAVSFSLGGYLLSMTWAAVYLLSLAWAPLIAFLCLRVVRHGRGRDVALAALALGCQVLSGEVQTAAFSGLIVLALVSAEPVSWRARLSGGLRLGIVALVGIGLSLPQVLPTLDVLSASTRAGGIGLDEAQHWSFHPLRVLELVVAGLFGEPVRGSTYLGFFLNDEGTGMQRLPWMHTPYLGSLSVILAVVGLSLPRRGHRRWTLAAGVLALTFLLLAFGRHTPVFQLFYQSVPGADLFRYPAKYFAVVALVIPMLAAAGLDACLRGVVHRRRGWVLALAAASLVGALVVASTLSADSGRALAEVTASVEVEEAEAIVQWALVREACVLTVICLFLYFCRRRRPEWVGIAAVTALAFQVGTQNLGAVRTMAPVVYDEPPPLAQVILADTADMGFPRVFTVSVESAATRHAKAPSAVAALRTQALVKNTAITYGIGYPDAYTAALSPRQEEFWAATEEVQKPIMDLFSMTHVLVPDGVNVPPGAGLAALPGAEGPGVTAYRNERALPLCRVVRHARAASSADEALRLVTSPEVLLGRSVALEASEDVTRFGGDGPAPPPGSCRTERPSRRTLVAHCELSEAAWIVCNESYNAGWSALLDGEEVPMYRANFLVMATSAAAGSRTLRLEYGEPDLGRGLAIAGVLALLCLLAILFKR